MISKVARTAQAILWLVIVVAASGGIWLTYHVQHDKVMNLRNEVASLQTQLKLANKPRTSQSTPGTASQATPTYTSTKGVKIIVYTPASGTAISSPVALLGQVPGNWSFEANFPVVITDSTGKEVAKGTAQLLGDWMTDSLVPFSVKLTYATKPTGTGVLVLQKDNPSGLAKNDDSISIPIKFQ